MGFEIKRYHGAYNVSARTSAVRYIVVHYTGSGTSAAGSALANCKYFSGGNRNASAHYFVDDRDIYEYADPATKYTWHCGDGKGRYGISNSNSVGIEVCQNGDRPYTEAEVERLAWLVRSLMDRFGVTADRVVRHYDASRKACPFYYTPSGSGGDSAWRALRDRITREEEEQDMTNEQEEMLRKVYDQTFSTFDPSGRDVEMNDHDHIKFIAAKQAKMDEKLDAIIAKLGE